MADEITEGNNIQSQEFGAKDKLMDIPDSPKDGDKFRSQTHALN
jgi:hypothetical protein